MGDYKNAIDRELPGTTTDSKYHILESADKRISVYHDIYKHPEILLPKYWSYASSNLASYLSNFIKELGARRI